MSKKEKSESKALVSIPQHDGTLDVSSRSDMENWVARQELINRVSVFFLVSFRRFRQRSAYTNSLTIE